MKRQVYKRTSKTELVLAKTHLPMMNVESWLDTWQCWYLAFGRFIPGVTPSSGSTNSVDANILLLYPPVIQIPFVMAEAP